MDRSRLHERPRIQRNPLLVRRGGRDSGRGGRSHRKTPMRISNIPIETQPSIWSARRSHQLNTIAERIGYVHMRVARQRFSFDHFNIRNSKLAYKFIQILNEQTGMSFTSWAKIRIDT